MPQRTVSLPQKNALSSNAPLFECVSRLAEGVNEALTVPTRSGPPVRATGTVALVAPVTRVIGPGTITTIAPVDFGTPVFLIAFPVAVTLGTGGNIGSAVTIAAGTGVILVPEASTGLWWPVA